MNWGTDYLIGAFPGGCSATVRDIPSGVPTFFKKTAVSAIGDHAMAMTVNDGHGMKASKRAAREAAAMQSINGSFPTEQDLITDVVTESRRNPQPQYRPL